MNEQMTRRCDDLDAEREALTDELSMTRAELSTALAELSTTRAALEAPLPSPADTRGAKLERRLIEHLELAISESQAESVRLVSLIDTVQSSRFWRWKLALRRLFGRHTRES